MKLDLSKLHAAAAAHTAATQALLDANSAHAAAAKAAQDELADAQGQIDALAAEVASQTSAIAEFNAANPAAPAA
ncbi:MAG TPA: hypothetical protein VEF90_16505 [Xanthobacteraceae bacterium]|nr:hypothetical protein [Xanthobacteraceae bacterium]